MHKRILLLTVTLVGLETGLYAQSPQHGQPAKYYVFNLGTPLGGYAEPVGINDLGWISGGGNLTGNTYSNAELWVGAPFDLGTLGGPNSNISWPNHATRGEVGGIAETAEANPYHESWSCSAFFPSAPTGDECLGFACTPGRLLESLNPQVRIKMEFL